MIQKTFSLTLDTKRGVIESPIVVVKGDTGNVFNIRVQDDGTDIDLTDASIIVAFRGANGSYTQDMESGGVTVDGAVVSFPLYKDSVSEGTNSCDVQIYTDGLSLVTTAAFTFECRQATVGEDTVEADASLPILLTLIQEMVDACDRFPAIEVEEIPHGHRINIVNFGGDVTTCDVMDGISGVYVGSGDMPDGYNVQIDPDGSASSGFIPEPENEGTPGQVLATDGAGGRYWKTESGGGGGSSDYEELDNKPTINSVTLIGNSTSSDLGLADESHTHTYSDLSGVAAASHTHTVSNVTDFPTDYHSNRNLLDNPWFTINQRGVETYTVDEYGVDRWKLVSGSATVTSNGITLNGTLRQIREDKLNRSDVTASVKMYSGTATASYDDSTKYFDIVSSGGTVRAAKLEIGSVSTLNYEAPPCIEEELLRCQRYFMKYDSGAQVVGFTSNTTNLLVDLYLPTVMRSNGDVTMSGINWIRSQGTQYNTPTWSSNSCVIRGNVAILNPQGLSCTLSKYYPVFIALGTVTIDCEL